MFLIKHSEGYRDKYKKLYVEILLHFYLNFLALINLRIKQTFIRLTQFKTKMFY